jgi:nucleoside-diphosphate-sugar epimerase
MNILITGAFGFVGNNLSHALKSQQKHRLTAVDLIAPAGGIYDSFYTWSQLDHIGKSGNDVFIHLAGKAHDTSNTADATSYFDINVGLTKKIMDLFLASTATKFIFFSSVKAVADTVDGAILTEAADCNPRTPYGQSKLQAEEYILAQPLRDGKKVYILRPCMIHGPGNKGNLNLLYKLVQKGIPWPLGGFANSRSFTSVENLQFVIAKLIEGDIEQGIYQMADDEPLSTNDLIELIGESFHRKAHIWNLSPRIIKASAKLGDMLRLPLNSERLKKLTESYVVSNQKIKRALGIDTMPLTSKAGMIKTFASFQ